MRGAAPLCTPLSGGSSAPPTPGDFLVRRKSPKTPQEPPGSWTSGEGGVAPFDPPVFCPSGIVHHQLDPQASSGVTHLPRHGLKAESAFSMKPREKTRPICSQTESGKSVYFLWQRAARVQAQRSTNKGGFSALAGFQRAAALGAPLVTFPATGKSPGVEGRSALLVGAGTTVLHKSPGVGGVRPFA